MKNRDLYAILYSDDYNVDYVISQSVEVGKNITEDMTITVSLGDPVFKGKTYQELKDWIQEVNDKKYSCKLSDK